MKPNYKKVILSTAMYTICAMVVLFAVAGALLIFVFTKDFADFCFGIGSERIASSLYYRVYEKSDNLLYLYKSLNIEIKLVNNDKTISYYQQFVSHDDYVDFVVALNENNKQLNVGLLEKSALLNDENYLAGKYCKALIANGDIEGAFDFALESFVGYETYSFFAQGVYAFSHLANENNSDRFVVKYEHFDDRLIDSMQDYFDSAHQLFVDNQHLTDNLSKAYLIALANRIIVVGQDINRLYQTLDQTDLISDNQAKMTSVNDAVKGLI